MEAYAKNTCVWNGFLWCSQKESEEGMKKCPKTASGKHEFALTKVKKIAWAIQPFRDVLMCVYCGLIDDRPTKGVSPKRKEKHG